MNFKKQLFGFMDMLRFKKMVPTRRQMLAQGENKPLPQEYRTNILAKKLHPGYMQVELTDARFLTNTIRELTFKRVDTNEFPFFRAGQYVSIQMQIGDSLVSRPYSIVSTPRQALENKLVLAVENAGFVSGYLNEKAKVGDRFVMTEPSGEFHYETLRDSQHIICIAGGSGITPFLSMAGSLADGDENYSMTLFYGARTAAQLAYKTELDALATRCNGLKVVYVLSDEEQPECETGFVSAQLMKKYTNLEDSTFFLCGPQAMYDFVAKELAPLHLPKKAVHRDATCCGDLPTEQPLEFKLTVHIRDEVYVVPAKENETLLTAMERAGLNAPNKCRAGGCGFCHSKWIAGNYRVAEGRDGRREADRKFGFIHPCVTYPLEDMEIDVPVAY
ncbi:MAG: 2Fe-2S iron-sulfur cluster-binding protein [Massiliimalia sp.]|jgi:ferredoxin-NADP reductase